MAVQITTNTARCAEADTERNPHNTKANHTYLLSKIEDTHVGVVLHIVHSYESVDELLAAIRQFLKEWANTSEGKRARAEACDDFNWGDFAEWGATLRETIPGVLDIQPVYPSTHGRDSAVIVDHDELLLDT